jgi:uncharacterized protein (DUF1697 family)
MAELTALCHDLNFREIETYLQSGNVVFHAPLKKSPRIFAQVLEQAIRGSFGYDVAVHVLDSAYLETVFLNNPFLNKENSDPAHCYVTFLFESPDKELLANLSSPVNETGRYKSVADTVYVHCPDGYGKTKINNQFFEKKLKLRASTRNWKTVTALRELAIRQVS